MPHVRRHLKNGSGTSPNSQCQLHPNRTQLIRRVMQTRASSTEFPWPSSPKEFSSSSGAEQKSGAEKGS